MLHYPHGFRCTREDVGACGVRCSCARRRFQYSPRGLGRPFWWQDFSRKALLQQGHLCARWGSARWAVHLDPEDENLPIRSAKKSRSVAPGPIRCELLLHRQTHPPNRLARESNHDDGVKQVSRVGSATGTNETVPYSHSSFVKHPHFSGASSSARAFSGISHIARAARVFSFPNTTPRVLARSFRFEANPACTTRKN